MFRGQFLHSVDAKGRISLPARFRDQLLAEGEVRFVLTPSPLDPCLHLYPLRAWEDLEKKISDLPRMDPNVVRFRRVYVSAAVECECDRTGRVLVPPHLREHARIDQGKDAVWAGMGHMLELWAKQELDRALSMTPEEAAGFRSAMEQLGL